MEHTGLEPVTFTLPALISMLSRTFGYFQNTSTTTFIVHHGVSYSQFLYLSLSNSPPMGTHLAHQAHGSKIKEEA